MRSPDEIRKLMAAMQRADERLVGADKDVAELQAQMQTALTEQAKAREGWRCATRAMAEGLGAVQPMPLEQKQAEQVAVVVPKMPELPEPSQSRAAIVRPMVLAELERAGRPVAMAELQQLIPSATLNEISRQLWQLKQDGKAQQVGRGHYADAGWRRAEVAV